MSSEGEPAVFDIELKALARNDSELLQITFYRLLESLLEPLQAYVDVVNGQLVLGGANLSISLFLDEEFLVLRDRNAPPVGYLATLEGDDLVLKHKE